jgi:hypothetical protein
MDYASPAPAAKALDAAPHAVVKFAKKVLDFDHRASQVLHKLSLYPFDLIIAPFSLFCGIYSIPFLIPLVAYFESIRLAVVILSSVSVEQAEEQNGCDHTACYHGLTGAVAVFHCF